MSRKATLLVSTALSFTAWMAPAAAQVALEEITVTAQRREQDLQQTPVAVSAFSASDLDKMQIAKITDLSSRAPNLFISNASSSPSTVRPFMRGAGQNDNTIPTGEQSVGFYLDDIYQARGNGLNLEFFDIERVEILRGPQGTLYGRNTAVGAVKIVTAVPDGTNTGKAELSYGRFNTVQARGVASFPIVEGKLSGSVSAMYSDTDGDRFNTTLNRRVNEREYGGLRGVLHYTPTDSVDIVVRAYYTDDDNQNNSVAPGDPATGRPLTGSLYITRTPFLPEGRLKQAGASGKVSIDVADGWTLNYIGGYLNMRDQSFSDVSGGVTNAAGQIISNFNIRFGLNNHQWSNELQLTGEALDGRFKGTAGLFYFKETNSSLLTQSLLGGVSRNSSASDLNTDSYAVFGQGTYYITEALGLTVGARMSWDKKDGAFALTTLAPVPAPTTNVIRSDSFKEFTPKFGLEYQANDDIMVFASAAKGFKAGGYNGRGGTPVVVNVPFNEEIVWTYEAGIKSEFLDNRLRVNAGYFYNDFSDLQLQAFLNLPGVPPGTVVTSNSGTAKVDGLESEFTFAAWEGMTINAAVATMWGKYKKVDPTSDVARNGATKIPTTPKYQFSLGYDYTTPIPQVNGNILLGTNYTRRASYFPGVVQNANNRTPATDMLDAYVGWQNEAENLTVTLSGKNLLDQNFAFTTLFIPGVVNGKYPSERMNWKLSAKFSY